MNDQSFWNFALERQAIWHRRFVQGLPRPWTLDPVLDRNKFTNVHRELDYGTQVLLKNLKDHASAQATEKVLNVFLYRAYNAPDVPWVSSVSEALGIATGRNVRWRGGEKRMFGDAWMITGGHLSPAERVTQAIGAWDTAKIAQIAGEASSLQNVFAAVKRESFFGSMVGWQVTLDLTYVFTQLSDDEWIPKPPVLTGNPHHNKPPAQHGPLAAITFISTELAPVEVIKYLREHQPREAWSKVAWFQKPELTLADVEHTLCEFHKYRMMSSGTRYGRARKFVPRNHE
jgi:hypothetical protein